MKKRIDKLLSIKSIVTLSTCSVFCVLSLRGDISGQEFLTIFTTTSSLSSTTTADYSYSICTVYNIKTYSYMLPLN